MGRALLSYFEVGFHGESVDVFPRPRAEGTLVGRYTHTSKVMNEDTRTQVLQLFLSGPVGVGCSVESANKRQHAHPSVPWVSFLLLLVVTIFLSFICSPFLSFRLVRVLDLIQCLEAVYSSDRVSEEVVMSVEETLRTAPAVQKMFLQVRRDRAWK